MVVGISPRPCVCFRERGARTPRVAGADLEVSRWRGRDASSWLWFCCCILCDMLQLGLLSSAGSLDDRRCFLVWRMLLAAIRAISGEECATRVRPVCEYGPALQSVAVMQLLRLLGRKVFDSIVITRSRSHRQLRLVKLRR